MDQEGSRRTPQNATAVVNLEKPQRSIKLNWEPPEIRPKHYEVEAIPETGKHKIRRCEKTEMIFPRLKTFTRYQFQISAIYDDEEGNICMTEQVQTYARLNQALPAHFQNLSGTSIDQSNSSITNTTQVMNARPEGFDKVEKPKMNMFNEADREMATVTWSHPSFSGFYDDYEIIQYHVEVFQLSKRIFNDFYKYQKSPSTGKFQVELGETYTIKIQTTYEELDFEKTHTSNSESVSYTRPTYPIIESKVSNNILHISWSSSIGAEKFRFEFLKEIDDQVIKKEEGEKDFRNMTFEIDHQVFHGVKYIVNVTAIGKLGGISRTRKEVLIGDERTPRFPRVSLNKDDMLHAVDISWESPEKIPTGYFVTCNGDSLICARVNNTWCTVKGLKAGTKYRFNINALHDVTTDLRYRCTTDEITTNPRPEHRPGFLDLSQSEDRPHSKITANWGKVNGATIYRVSIMTGKLTTEYYTAENFYVAHGLEPTTEYVIAVAAGNQYGFGEEFTEKCTTAMKPPTDIILSSLESDHGVRVEWSGEAEKFEVRIHDAENETLVRKENVENSTTNCEFTGLEGNKKYFVEIEVIGRGTSSQKKRSDIVQTVPPRKVIKTVEHERDDKSVSTDVYLDWQKDLGSLTYDIEVRTDGKVENVLHVEDIHFHRYRCLKAGNLYEFRLRAVNTAGFGRWSAAKSIQLQNPEPPKKIDVTFDAEKPWRKATIKWDRPKNVSCFKIQIRPPVVDDWIQDDNFYTFELGKPLMKCEVSIYSGHDNEILSTKPTKRTFKMGKLEPPSHILAVHDEIRPWHIAHIKWPSTNGVNAYKVCICGADNVESEVVQDKLQYALKGLPGKEYKIMIHPGDGSGFFSPSYAETTICMDKIPVVEEDTITAEPNVNATEIKLTWKEMKGIGSFRIKWYRSGSGSSKTENHTLAHGNHISIKSDRPVETLEVEISSVSGEDSGMSTRKTFSLLPGKLSRPNIIARKSSEEIEIGWSKLHVADEYRIKLRAKDDDTFIETYQVRDNIYTLVGLVRGRRYNVAVCGSNEAGCGEYSDTLEFKMEYNENEIVAKVKELSEKAFESKVPRPFIKPILNTHYGKDVQTDGLVRNSPCSTSVILGHPRSGLTSFCHFIAKEFSVKNVVFLLRGTWNVEGSMLDIIKTHLNNNLQLELSDEEITIFFEWMHTNSSNVIFVIDDLQISNELTLLRVHADNTISYTSFIRQLLERSYFVNATVFAAARVNDLTAMKGLNPERIVSLDSYNIGSSQNLADLNAHAHWQLFTSARTCFTALNLRKRPHASLASTYLDVYCKLYKDLTRRAGLSNEIMDCSNVYKLHTIKTICLRDLGPHEKFVLAMHAVFYFKSTTVVVDLAQFKTGSDFTLLCGGLLNPEYSEQAFSLLLPRTLTDATRLREAKHQYIYNVMSPHGNERQKQFFCAIGKRLNL